MFYWQDCLVEVNNHFSTGVYIGVVDVHQQSNLNLHECTGNFNNLMLTIFEINRVWFAPAVKGATYFED